MQESYNDIKALAQDLRDSQKKYTILFAHNGIGKTSLSLEFKNLKEKGSRDTLYYNAFTEDLFLWDNDLDNDQERILLFRRESHFFDGLDANEMATRIREHLNRYVDFDFDIKLDVIKRKENEADSIINYISFKRLDFNPEDNVTEWRENIKISRGEENIFKWCFFLAIAQLAIDRNESYKWVKYIFIDDPISSLDDNNAVLVANHLASLIKPEGHGIHTIITTHHGLFYNVLCNELKNAERFYLYKEKVDANDVRQQTQYLWKLKDMKDTPFFHHVAIIKELDKAVAPDGQLYTYHFNMFRNVLEKTAAFHGFEKFGDCVKKFENDPDEQLYSRMINILSHGSYSIFEPIEMNDENKRYFRDMYKAFKEQFPFKVNI